MTNVLDHLLRKGRPFLVLPAPQATSVREAAETHGIDLAEVIRTEVVIAASGPALMLVAATHHLDLEMARTVVGDPGARLASLAEMRSFAPGCDVGAVPPMALLLLARMYVDPSIAERPQVVFPAGRYGLLVRMDREELFHDDPYVVVPLTGTTVASEPPPPLSSRRAVLADDGLVPVHMAEPRAGGDRGADVA